MRVLASHLWIVAALLSVVMISCSREEPGEQRKPEDFDVNEWENVDIDGDASMSENTILFSVGDSASVMRAATTFDGTGYTFSVGDMVTIEMYRGSTKVGTKKYRVKDASGTLEFADTGLPFAWESKAETVKLRAWSYGNTTALTTEPVGNAFTLNTTQTEVTTGQDNYQELLYSPQQSYGYSTNVALRLYHQMARLTVTLTHSKTEESLSVTSITFGDGTLPVTAKFSETGINVESSVFIGSWKDLVNGDGSTGMVIPRADVANEKYSAVLFPGTMAKDKRLITLTTADGTFAYKLPSAITLQAGKQYDYKINVKDLVPVSELTISDITGTFTYNGSAQTPKPATVKYGDKTLVEGTDYKLSWSNNINAGTATCTVTGIGTVFTGSQSKTFTINKAPSSINLSNTSFSISGVDTKTFTVTRPGNGNITAISSNTAIATTSVNQSTGVVTITSTGQGTSTITVTMSEGTNYLAYSNNDKSVSVNVSIDIKKNPLWWVARYNMASAGNMYTSHSQSNSAKWNYADALNITLNGYHQPSLSEQSSIIPSDNSAGSGMNIWAQTCTLSNPLEFSEIACDVGGSVVAARKSYFGKITEADYYAVRFIGTTYASAWHYKWITSPCKGLLIESYMIPISMTVNEAKTLLTSLASSTIFTNTYNAATANQTPTSTAATTYGFVQRFLEANGLTNVDDGKRGTYLSKTTRTGDASLAHHWNFWNYKGTEYEENHSDAYYMHIHCHSTSNLGAVRLFINH